MTSIYEAPSSGALPTSPQEPPVQTQRPALPSSASSTSYFNKSQRGSPSKNFIDTNVAAANAQVFEDPDAGEGTETSMEVTAHPKMRKRTKTGCLTCRKRRIKCGEEKPTCSNCIKSKRQCEGYNQRIVFKDPIGDWPSHPGVSSTLHYHNQMLPRQTPAKAYDDFLRTMRGDPERASALPSLQPRLTPGDVDQHLQPVDDLNIESLFATLADRNPPCNTLWVGNLPISTSEDELKALFSKQHGYKRLCFRTKQNGPLCFVEFEDVSSATQAMKELHGYSMSNSVQGGIRLSFSENPLGVRNPGGGKVNQQNAGLGSVQTDQMSDLFIAGSSNARTVSTWLTRSRSRSRSHSRARSRSRQSDSRSRSRTPSPVPRETGRSPTPSALTNDDSKAKDRKPQINHPSTPLAGTGSYLVEERRPSVGRARPPARHPTTVIEIGGSKRRRQNYYPVYKGDLARNSYQSSDISSINSALTISSINSASTRSSANSTTTYGTLSSISSASDALSAPSGDLVPLIEESLGDKHNQRTSPTINEQKGITSGDRRIDGDLSVLQDDRPQPLIRTPQMIMIERRKRQEAAQQAERNLVEVNDGKERMREGAAAAAQQPKVLQTAFIHKLHNMLENKYIQHLIFWSSSNESFFISPSREFSRVLSSYFKHTDISSFERQLNMYGFHKVGDIFPTGSLDSPLWEFKHGNGRFKRGDLVPAASTAVEKLSPRNAPGRKIPSPTAGGPPKLSLADKRQSSQERIWNMNLTHGATELEIVRAHQRQYMEQQFIQGEPTGSERDVGPIAIYTRPPPPTKKTELEKTKPPAHDWTKRLTQSRRSSLTQAGIDETNQIRQIDEARMAREREAANEFGGSSRQFFDEFGNGEKPFLELDRRNGAGSIPSLMKTGGVSLAVPTSVEQQIPVAPEQTHPAPLQAREFLFADGAETGNSREDRHKARSFVMQKARRERPWSTNKNAAGQGGRSPATPSTSRATQQFRSGDSIKSTSKTHLATAIDTTIHSEPSAPYSFQDRVPQSENFAKYSTFQPPSARLEELCRRWGIKSPKWRRFPQTPGQRTAWSATVNVEGQDHAARLWYNDDGDGAMEDAAEVALEDLIREAAEWRGDLSKLQGILFADVQDLKFISGPFANRINTGCGTCRRYRNVCDEVKPECNNCQSAGFVCESYTNMSKIGVQTPYLPLAQEIPTKGKDIPSNARWTKIDRSLVHPQALEEARERFEERLDCVIVLRVLTKLEIQKLADRTKEIRESRENDQKASDDSMWVNDSSAAPFDFMAPNTVIPELSPYQFYSKPLQLLVKLKPQSQPVKNEVGSSVQDGLLEQLAEQFCNPGSEDNGNSTLTSNLRWGDSSFGQALGSLTNGYTVWEVSGAAKVIAQRRQMFLDQIVVAWGTMSELYHKDAFSFDMFMVGQTVENARLTLIVRGKVRTLRKSSIERFKDAKFWMLYPEIAVLHLTHDQFPHSTIMETTETSGEPTPYIAESRSGSVDDLGITVINAQKKNTNVPTEARYDSVLFEDTHAAGTNYRSSNGEVLRAQVASEADLPIVRGGERPTPPTETTLQGWHIARILGLQKSGQMPSNPNEPADRTVELWDHARATSAASTSFGSSSTTVKSSAMENSSIRPNISIGRKRLAPISSGPSPKFAIGSHPDDFNDDTPVSPIRPDIIVRSTENDPQESDTWYVESRYDNILSMNPANADATPEVSDNQSLSVQKGYFTAATANAKSLPGSHPLRLSIALEHSAFLWDSLRDHEGSRHIARQAIQDVYRAQEAMEDSQFEEAAELVSILGRMSKRKSWGQIPRVSGLAKTALKVDPPTARDETSLTAGEGSVDDGDTSKSKDRRSSIASARIVSSQLSILTSGRTQNVLARDFPAGSLRSSPATESQQSVESQSSEPGGDDRERSSTPPRGFETYLPTIPTHTSAPEENNYEGTSGSTDVSQTRQSMPTQNTSSTPISTFIPSPAMAMSTDRLNDSYGFGTPALSVHGFVDMGIETEQVKYALEDSDPDLSTIVYKSTGQKTVGRKRLPPLSGAPIQFEIASHPDDLRNDTSVGRSRSDAMNKDQRSTLNESLNVPIPMEVSRQRVHGLTEARELPMDRWRRFSANEASNLPSPDSDEDADLDPSKGKSEIGPSQPRSRRRNAQLQEHAMTSRVSPIIAVETYPASSSLRHVSLPYLEGDKASMAVSNRGTSVGTDIGNDIDNTEWSDADLWARAPDWSKRTKTFARVGIDTKLETLDEESSDENDSEKECPQTKEEASRSQSPDSVSTASSRRIDDESSHPHMLPEVGYLDDVGWKKIREVLPDDWRWDVDYTTTHNYDGNDHVCLTCTPTEPEDPKNFPLTIHNVPVVLPVEHQWPPMAGVNPPPDPRPSALIDCTVELPLGVIRDLFLTFEGSIGFYLLINGLLQIIVTEDFDTEWASSHLPHKYGGLKVCYIHQNMEPTMFQVPSKTETMKSKASHATQSSSMSSIFRSSSSRTTNSLVPSLQLNDFIEARAKSSSRKDKYAGRIGLKVEKCGDPYLIMSTHVITEAILAKGGIFSRKDRSEKLEDDWNVHAEIWAGNEKIGSIGPTFDKEAEIYPNGFNHDVTLVKATNPATIKDIASPLPNLGWLSRSSWHSLRQRSAAVKILGSTESHRAAKTIKSSLHSEVLVVGEGIFLNQNSAKPTRDHDISTWKDLVSRAVLYRVYPDFDPPTGYSGIALYADGTREDGTEGPGIVGFQSFVQRSGVVQSFEMEGGALEKRLKLGRVAFYGAFMVPGALKEEYQIV